MPASTAPTHSVRAPKPAHTIKNTEHKTASRIFVGDCRDILPSLPEVQDQKLDLVFADPPFNWARDYDRDRDGKAWDDATMSPEQYLKFTYDWLDLCIGGLSPTGSLWVNIPDDWAAEIVVHLKQRGLSMVNWCVWHYRFGQNTKGKFISSKVHALYFCNDPDARTWNADPILELSDRRAIYSDKRTESKRDGLPPGHRVPMDVWYGQYWGRIQGNNKERRDKHDNQLPELYLHRVIACSSNPGDLVLDPFLGSGTTGVVAHAMDRDFVGIEYAKPNAERAAERIKLGPVRDLDANRGASSAIFGSRAPKPRQSLQ